MASIHPVKMLYIWPYFMFFSIPLLYPYLISGLIPRGMLPRASRTRAKVAELPRLFLQLSSIILMLVVVHLNTTVHPFTLADNRHYVFYVFRILLRHRLIKYAAAPVYFYCAWATIAALGGLSDAQGNSGPRTRDLIQIKDNLRWKLPPPLEADAPGGMRISFVLVWLLATTLSLVTAPLVEPRYFIVPWLFWRLHVHRPCTRRTAEQAGKKSDARKNKDIFSFLDSAMRSSFDLKYEHRLWLETAWFLFINWATAYVFLYWGFEWPQEPGKVQRFMW